MKGKGERQWMKGGQDDFPWDSYTGLTRSCNRATIPAPGDRPTSKGRETRLSCLRPVNLSMLSLSPVCFLSWWHMLCSSTTRSSGKQLPPGSNGPF